MNNFKKIGMTALAASLVSTSAFADTETSEAAKAVKPIFLKLFILITPFIYLLLLIINIAELSLFLLFIKKNPLNINKI